MVFPLDESGFAHRYEAGHHDAKTAAVVACLDKWLRALDSGDVENWMPDPDFPRKYTEEEVDGLIQSVDEYMDQQAGGWARSLYDAPPDYRRLKPAQRLAMVQDLARTLMAFPKDSQPSPVTPPAQAPPVEPLEWLDDWLYEQNGE